ncbi:hypothetical protein THASP1DRAFT_22801, partial [Thamnocephalis sphaerospora]
MHARIVAFVFFFVAAAMPAQAIPLIGEDDLVYGPSGATPLRLLPNCLRACVPDEATDLSCPNGQVAAHTLRTCNECSRQMCIEPLPQPEPCPPPEPTLSTLDLCPTMTCPDCASGEHCVPAPGQCNKSGILCPVGRCVRTSKPFSITGVPTSATAREPSEKRFKRENKRLSGPVNSSWAPGTGGA